MKSKVTIEGLRRQIKGSAVENINPHLFDENLPAKNSDNGKPGKKSKYGNKKVEYDGYVFDSKHEANRYFVLKTRKAAGEIYNLFVHVEFKLSICIYEADFTYQLSSTHKLVVEDAKSVATRKNRVYRLKKKMMEKERGIIIKEV